MRVSFAATGAASSQPMARDVFVIGSINVDLVVRAETLPGPGEKISAAGPVYPGSYGQQQIQADVLRVAP